MLVSKSGITSIDEFESQLEYWVDIASDYKSDFVVFPEYFSLQLLSVEEEELAPEPAIRRAAESLRE